MVNYFALRALGLFGVMALVLASWPRHLHGALRIAAAFGALLSVMALVSMLCAHIVLTERTAALTGQTFSTGWGLW